LEPKSFLLKWKKSANHFLQITGATAIDDGLVYRYRYMGVVELLNLVEILFYLLQAP
jgi:hypothetical protein